ncbi:hypothetical protein [Vibrio rhizosphaerae]|uniref:hypothetical protein n=1 Tax=Vibrio rhizosphaerae TaxID=398736 RepID=UPI00056DDC4F|nr:hypothetical protein [Vibrio rhizosphaerae]
MNDWNEIENEKGYSLQRTFSDGTDVIISIAKNGDAYEVWSSAESRTSGPNDHLDGKADTFDLAKEILLEEAKGWEEDLL